MTDKTHALIRYLWPLLATTGTVWAVWIVFHRGEVGRRTDSWILVWIGSVYLIATLVLLVFVRRWELRSLGQVVTYLADAVLYSISGASRLGWRDPFRPWELDLIRAMFVVGGAFLIGGVVLWGVRTRGGTREPTWDGRERRRWIRRAADRGAVVTTDTLVDQR